MVSVLNEVNPDIVVVTLGREMAIIRHLMKSGRKLVGETHLAKPYIRNLHLLRARGGIFKIIAKFLEHKQEKGASYLDRLVVLTEATRKQWEPYANTIVIPNFNFFLSTNTGILLKSP